MVQKENKEKKHLTQEERVVIWVWLKERKWYRWIGRKLGRDHTVISREIKRNSVRDSRTWELVYKPVDAERLRLERKQLANSNHIILLKDHNFCLEIEKLLKEKCKKWVEEENWWLDELLWRLKLEWYRSLNTTTLYRFIENHKPSRKKYLRHWKHGYRKRWNWKKKTALVWVPLIEERAESVDERKEIWHWEADMVVWPQWEKWWLVTLLERKSRYTLISKIPASTKAYAYAAMYTMLHKETVLTTTSDNWSEFANLALLWKRLWIPVYRCHPYASREKWANEKNNWFIRWLCGKWLSIQQYDDEYIAKVQHTLNHKPRKILWYRTPYEIYHNITKSYIK